MLKLIDNEIIEEVNAAALLRRLEGFNVKERRAAEAYYIKRRGSWTNEKPLKLFVYGLEKEFSLRR